MSNRTARAAVYDKPNAPFDIRTYPLRDAGPDEVLVRYAAERMPEGYDEILLGHYHQPRSYEVGGGTLRLVDAWFNTREIEWLS